MQERLRQVGPGELHPNQGRRPGAGGVRARPQDVLQRDVGEVEVEAGGQTVYIARGEDEELVTVNPEENTLSLVYGRSLS